jgi:ribosomal protein L37E
MSESGEISVLVEYLDHGNVRQTVLLGPGDQFDVQNTYHSIERVEVRPAEDDDLETDGGEIPDHYWIECRKCGHRTVAFERYCRHCDFDRQGHRAPEYRADGGRRFDGGEAPLTDDGWPARTDGGTETIDESQTVREAAQPLATTLRGCRRSDHCHRLAEVVTGAATVDALDYEDLFYPLRCHRDDGLVLRVEGPSGQNWLQYGSGDLFYWMTDDERTIVSAVDPFELWDAISPGSVEVEPVLVEDTPFGED